MRVYILKRDIGHEIHTIGVFRTREDAKIYVTREYGNIVWPSGEMTPDVHETAKHVHLPLMTFSITSEIVRNSAGNEAYDYQKPQTKPIVPIEQKNSCNKCCDTGSYLIKGELIACDDCEDV